MKLPAAHLFVRAITLLAAGALLAGCDAAPPEPDMSTTPIKRPSTAATKAAPASDPTAKMARAVGNGKPGAAVDIRYEILARPEVGKPVEVDVALLPGPGVDSMEATFTGMDGITLAGSLVATFPSIKAGETYKHTLSLLPDRNGVFYITVAVNTEMGQIAMGRTFSLPFVVGKTPVQQKAAPTKDSKGEAVEVMKAT